MRHLALALALLTAACGTETRPETDASEPDSSAVAAEPPAGEGEPLASTEPATAELCVSMGPQTPRDIGSPSGLNTEAFPLAPPAGEMNLCNIHTHTNGGAQGAGVQCLRQ